MAAYWLMKSEPYVFSWDQLVKDGSGCWDGVRNHLAKKNLQAMRVGDLAFFYHSNEGKEIVGIMRITKEAHPDPTDTSGKFVQVGVEPVERLPTPVSLTTIKATEALASMALVRQSRLSVQPVSAEEWKTIVALSNA